MAVDVIMPQMGESIFEGTITKWLKKPGDKIERDEPLFEISTDKVDAEIPSPAAGVLKEIKVKEGQTVPIQTVVASIEASGSAAAAPAPAPAKTDSPKAAASPAPKAEAPKPAGAAAPPRPAQPTAAAASAPPQKTDANGDKIRSSPLVRRMAREHNIDLAQVSGTGAGGRVSKQDILAATEGAARSGTAPAPGAAPARSAAPPPTGATLASGAIESAVPRERMYFGHYEVQPMSNMRQKIAEHMVLSKRVSPHVYSVDEVNVSGISALRAKSKEKFEQESGTKLTFMPFFIRAAVEALRAFPTVNASVDGTNIVLASPWRWIGD
jgi:pyruvate dehydrogenase E2 component (dihydrolipoamide acetyltransferase)